MENAITFEQIEDKIILIHNQQVIIDSDLAMLYCVETKEINQAVKNNPDKFPEGYIIVTPFAVKTELVKNFDQSNKLNEK